MTLDDRIKIQEGLDNGLSIRAIAKIIDKEPSSVLREIKTNRSPGRKRTPDLKEPCKNKANCEVRHICGNSRCKVLCRTCISCVLYCSDYLPSKCTLLDKAPHVCNSCDKKLSCNYERIFYYASNAHNISTDKKISSRTGINSNPEDIEKIDRIVSPLLKKGQSVSHIYATHKDEIDFSKTTFYRYIDNSVFTARNSDLPRKVSYKVRKAYQRKPLPEEEKLSVLNRRFENFQEYMIEHPDASVVEMDLVVGTIESHKVLLTMLFRSCNLMIAFLLPSKSPEHVVAALNWLCNELGIEIFKKLFEVILTDRGLEFMPPEPLEVDEYGEVKTQIFYCDAYCSWQKGTIERNHEFIRYVLPKGTNFDFLTQEKVTLLINHINSLKRKKLNYTTPYLLSKLLIDNKLHEIMGLVEIKPDDVNLKPDLLH